MTANCTRFVLFPKLFNTHLLNKFMRIGIFRTILLDNIYLGFSKRDEKEVFLQVASRAEVLGIIQHYYDVTHTGIRSTFHAIRCKYSWAGTYQDVKECKLNIFQLLAEFM